MKYLFTCSLSACLLLTFITTKAQQTPQKSDSIYTQVDELPVFPGGDQGMYQYLIHNIRYPSEAAKKNIQGLVVAEFTVNKTGQISDIIILKSVGSGLDEEAARVIAAMPAWKPGKQNGVVVKTKYTLPVRFSINGSRPEKSEKVPYQPLPVSNFSFSEQQPKFPGGRDKMLKFISKNMHFPEDAAKQKISGTVVTSFIVKANGEISDIKIIKPVSDSIDAEAIRIISKMPRWEPGKQNGKLENMAYSLPIRFAIQ